MRIASVVLELMEGHAFRADLILTGYTVLDIAGIFHTLAI